MLTSLWWRCIVLPVGQELNYSEFQALNGQENCRCLQPFVYLPQIGRNAIHMVLGRKNRHLLSESISESELPQNLMHSYLYFTVVIVWKDILNLNVTLYILTAVIMKITIFWDVIPCILVDRHQALCCQNLENCYLWISIFFFFSQKVRCKINCTQRFWNEGDLHWFWLHRGHWICG